MSLRQVSVMIDDTFDPHIGMIPASILILYIFCWCNGTLEERMWLVIESKA